MRILNSWCGFWFFNDGSICCFVYSCFLPQISFWVLFQRYKISITHWSNRSKEWCLIFHDYIHIFHLDISLYFVFLVDNDLSCFRYNVAIKCATITPGISCFSSAYWVCEIVVLNMWQIIDLWCIGNWQMKLVWRNLIWRACGRVLMEQLGTFWMVSEWCCKIILCYCSLTTFICWYCW